MDDKLSRSKTPTCGNYSFETYLLYESLNDFKKNKWSLRSKSNCFLPSWLVPGSFSMPTLSSFMLSGFVKFPSRNTFKNTVFDDLNLPGPPQIDPEHFWENSFFHIFWYFRGQLFWKPCWNLFMLSVRQNSVIICSIHTTTHELYEFQTVVLILTLHNYQIFETMSKK